MTNEILTIPACPSQVYDDFWLKVRKASGKPNCHDIIWMTEEEAIAVCVKEGITSRLQLVEAMKS